MRTDIVFQRGFGTVIKGLDYDAALIFENKVERRVNVATGAPIIENPHQHDVGSKYEGKPARVSV